MALVLLCVFRFSYWGVVGNEGIFYMGVGFPILYGGLDSLGLRNFTDNDGPATKSQARKVP